MKPDIRYEADEYFYTWAEDGIGLCLSGFRETDAGLIKANINVESTVPDNSGHVYWSYITLSTSADRDRVWKKIHAIVPLDDHQWEKRIDRVFQDAARKFTETPDPQILADVPLEEDAGYLFRPILPLGQVCIFMADQGVSKSYLQLYLAVCAAAGVGSIFGWPAREGPVIYYDWETDGPSQRRRLEWVCRGLGLRSPPRNLHYLNMASRGRLMDRVRELRAQVARLEPVMVCVDSLTFATGADLNSTEFSGPTMTAIGSLGEGVTKVVSAHYAKQHREGPGRASVMGSGLFEFKARSLWELRRETEGGSSFNVAMIHRKLSDGADQPPLAYRLTFDNDARAATFGAARLEDSPELEERSLSVAARIRLLVKAKPDARVDTLEVSRALGISPDDAGRNLRRMPDMVRLSDNLGGRGKPTVWGLGDRRNGNTETRTYIEKDICPPNGGRTNITDDSRTKADESAFTGLPWEEPEELPF